MKQNLTEEGPSGVDRHAGPAVRATPCTFQHDEGGGRTGLPLGEQGRQDAGEATIAASVSRWCSQLWDSAGKQPALGIIAALLARGEGPRRVLPGPHCLRTFLNCTSRVLCLQRETAALAHWP
jgi:hypothetical protein